MSQRPERPLLVVGAGIAGLTAALEAAEAGVDVILVEREATVGGRVLRNHHYFPKMCPPSCGMEINVRRLERNPRIEVRIRTTVTAADRTDDGWRVTLTTAPAWVTERCTACGDCLDACTTEVPDPYEGGRSTAKAIRLPHVAAWPRRFVFDRETVGDAEAKAIADACTYDAIDLGATETTDTVEVSAVIVATGWHPYPIDRLSELGGGVHADVIANVDLERMASEAGPTDGQIVRPSTGEAPKRVAFVQCAGSRDVNHLPYCSGVCCLASLKQALYVKEQVPDAEVTIFYIDRRAPGRNEDVLLEVAGTEGVRLVKGKVGSVHAVNGHLQLKVEDVESGRLLEDAADLVVLATGMVPNGLDEAPALRTRVDEDGFQLDDIDTRVVVAGVARRPEDVASVTRDATGAAARAWAAAGRRT